MRWFWLAAIGFLSVGLAWSAPIADVVPGDVAAWHQAGHRGRGVTVAVLDTGFRGFQSALDRLGVRDVEVQSFRHDRRMEARDSDHGLLCVDVIHAIAPEARLLLLDWQPGEPATFLEAVRHARRRGARVLSCSVAMPSWSDGRGGGPVHEQLEAIAGDMLCVASAGNLAERHWSGSITPDAEGWHTWPDGSTSNKIRTYASDVVTVELAITSAPLRLVVVDDRGRIVADGGVNSRWVQFQPRSSTDYFVRLQGPAGGVASVFVLGGYLEKSEPVGSVPFPGDHPRWLTVGAESSGRRAAYCSLGRPGSGKPELFAMVPWAVQLRRDPFGGTSAAAPQVAGAAALIWSRHPKLTADEVKTLLKVAAQPSQEPRWRMPALPPEAR